MQQLLTLGRLLDAQARTAPDRLGVRDLDRALTFGQWNSRAQRLANALTGGLALAKGDRVAVLAYNRLEWAEIYAACAKSGLIVVPINFRLAPAEIRFLIEDADAACLLAEDSLYGQIEEIRGHLDLPDNRFVHFGGAATPEGWQAYEELIVMASGRMSDVVVADVDPWALMYTSGTTGKPKGVVRSHRGMTLLSLATQVELSIGRADDALLVMPMCHANSLNFFCSFAHCGGVNTIYSRPSFDPEHALSVMEEIGSTFTSLVPTHYIMMLAEQKARGRNRDLGAMRKMMISSAPARADTKRQVMEMFPNSGLFELYGSSEAGWVTMLHPDEQFTHLGTVGRECVGSAPVRLLDDEGQEVPDGEAGELYSSTPYTFDGYWKLPDKTAEAFRGDYCTVGDMALRDEHGFLRLIDRKKNMIISGGENIYPSEVEAALGASRKVKDVAVIGLPDEKWGERVHAVIVLHDGAKPDEGEILSVCEGRIARYKMPRSVSFVGDQDIPRTATGKVQHRELRARIIEQR